MRERGAANLEYGLIVGLIGIVALAVIGSVGGRVVPFLTRRVKA